MSEMTWLRTGVLIEAGKSCLGREPGVKIEESGDPWILTPEFRRHPNFSP